MSAANRLPLACLWILTLLLADNVHARDSDRDELEAALIVLDSDKRQLAADGQLTTRENGRMPGVSMAIHEQYGSTALLLSASVFDGVLDYREQIQSANPVSYRSDTRMAELEIGITQWLHGASALRIGIGADLGARYRQRQLRPTALPSLTTADDTEYRTVYASLALMIAFPVTRDLLWSIEARASRELYNDIRLEYSSGAFDRTRLEPGSGRAYRIALPLEYRLSAFSSLTFRPYYEFRESSASAVRELTLNGIASGMSVQEPDTEISDTGLSISYRALF